MIQVIPVHHDVEGLTPVHSHILHPQPSITLMINVQGEKENIVSILEDHILETISSTEWSREDSDQDFTFLTEHYNRFIKNLEPVDLDGISILLGLLKGDHLILSTIGNASAYLVEGDDISKITSTEKDRYDFHALTSGDVNRGAFIFLSNDDLGNVLGESVLSEFSELNREEFEQTASTILAQELHRSLHIIRINYPQRSYIKTPETIRNGRQSDILKQKGIKAVKFVRDHQIWENIFAKAQRISLENNTPSKYAFLTLGAILLVFLLYFMFRGLSGIVTSGSDTLRDKVLEAKTLIEESQKLTGNPESFEKNIAEAEEILFSLRNEQAYLSDTQELENRIDALKKEVYDIQTVNLATRTSIVPVSNAGISPIGIGEYNNKMNIIGKTNLVHDYILGSDIAAPMNYPQNEEAISTDMTSNGVSYILTKSNHILTLNSQQNAIVNVVVGGKEIWDESLGIHVYNGNIYLLSNTRNQIYKYRPAANGFSVKADVLESPYNGTILDFSIDGGFYFLMSDGKIGRYISTNNAGITFLTLNQIPGAWNIDTNAGSQIIGTDSLSYVYIRNGKRIWIFQPNSRNYKDVSALTYVAQLEIQTSDDIRTMNISKDGTIMISTTGGIYQIGFSVVNNKLILN